MFRGGQPSRPQPSLRRNCARGGPQPAPEGPCKHEQRDRSPCRWVDCTRQAAVIRLTGKPHALIRAFHQGSTWRRIRIAAMSSPRTAGISSAARSPRPMISLAKSGSCTMMASIKSVFVDDVSLTPEEAKTTLARGNVPPSTCPYWTGWEEWRSDGRDDRLRSSGAGCGEPKPAAGSRTTMRRMGAKEGIKRPSDALCPGLLKLTPRGVSAVIKGVHPPCSSVAQW
jgi:hypothetical protein